MIFFFLSLIGLINAVYLQFLHTSIATTCIIGDGCRDVLSSEYSTVFSIPISAIGISVYLILFAIQLLEKTNEVNRSTAITAKMAVLLPSAAGGILLFLTQFLYVGAFCPFCTLNSTILLLLFFLTYRLYIKNNHIQLTLSPFQWVALVAIGLSPILLTGPFNRYAPPTAIGTIAGEPIHTTSLTQSSKLGPSWRKIKQQEYTIKKDFFYDTLLSFLANKSGQSVDDYVQTTIAPSVRVEASDIQSFYNKNKEALPDKPYDDIKPAISQYLKREKESLAIRRHLQSQAATHDAVFTVQRPFTDRIIQSNRLRQYTIGKKDAPIHILKFSDLECGHCRRSFFDMKPLLKKYKDIVYFEYRHFPLRTNSPSERFSKGGVCAGEQDRFFDFIGAAFDKQRRLSNLSPRDLANDLNLDPEAFDACMSSSLPKKVVDLDLKEARKLNIKSTPTFYINGHLWTGIPSDADIQSFL